MYGNNTYSIMSLKEVTPFSSWPTMEQDGTYRSSRSVAPEPKPTFSNHP
jgi:hypothetical protein